MLGHHIYFKFLFKKLFGIPQYTPYTKDAFHRYVINGEDDAVNPKKKGTKVAAHHVLEVQGGEERVLRVRLTIAKDASDKPFGEEFEEIFQSRKDDADEFYSGVISGKVPTLFLAFSIYALNPGVAEDR